MNPESAEGKSAQVATDDQTVLVVSRHVCLERIRAGSSENQNDETRRPPQPSGLETWTLSLNVATGACAWVEGWSLQVLSRQQCLLPEGGYLKDSEGTCLPVGPGAWLVRVQMACIDEQPTNRYRNTYRHEW